MEISPCHNSVAGHQIATNFCTCHDSTAVVPCTKFCSNHCIRIEVRVKRNFHRIWIAMEKPLVKRGPGPVQIDRVCSCTKHMAIFMAGAWTSNIYTHQRYCAKNWLTSQQPIRFYCALILKYVKNGSWLALYCQHRPDSGLVWPTWYVYR